MKSKITCIFLILIILVNIFMPILTYAGDEENNPYLETEAYYSSVSLAVEDANNNTIENADSNVDEGVVSLVISNNKATIRLLKDCDEENELQINNNIDLYLNGKKMNFSAINSEQGYGFVINKDRTLSVYGENKGEEGSEIYHDESLNKQFFMFQVIGNLHINGGKYVNNVNDNGARFINVKKTSTHNITVENIKLNMNAFETAVGIKTDNTLNNSTIIANNNECEIESAKGIAVFFHGNGNGIFDNNKMKMNSHKKNAWGIVCFNYSNTEIKNNEIITESEEIIDNENYKVYGIFISLYSNSRIDNNEITIKSEKGTTHGIFIEEHCNVNIKGNQIISESKENTSFGMYIEEHCNVNIKDNQIFSESVENTSYGIYTAAKNTLIEDSSIKSISRAPNGDISYRSNGIVKDNDGKMIIRNSNVVSDSRSNNYGSNTYHRTTSLGISSNSGELKLYNVNVKTTDYGVSTSIDTKLYVKGGTFETYGHAPFYLSNGLGENYIEDATLISQNWDNYDGEFQDYTGDWINYTSCIYMGGGDKEWNSGVSAYLNNCVLDYKGEDRTESANGYFVLRGTSGEKNINLYISNSKFEYDTINRYRIDDSTDNVYFGSGNVLPEIEPTLILDRGDATENNVHYTDETYKKDDVSYLQIGDAIYKKVYVEGEKFDRANLEVKYIDENNEEHIITDYEIVNEQDELTENQTYITVKYNELELQVPIKVFPSSYKDLIFKKDIYCNFDEILKNVVYIDVNSDTVRCIIKNITGIKVVKEPNKTNYVKGEKLNLTGVEIALECEDGTTGVIEVTEDNFAGYDANIEGEQTVTVTYAEGITADFKVNVHNNVTAIEVTKAPTKTSYVKGEELDLAGIEVTATYEDGTTGVIELPADKFTGYDKNTLGEQTVTVTYAEGKTAEFKVNVHNEVTGIEITKAPTKTSYVKGEELNLAGIEVTATYEDGTTGVIELPADKFTGYDKNTLGEQTVTVTYAEGKTAEFKVNVHNEVTGIEITKAPTKTSYVKGEELNLAGIEVTATYEDGTTGVIAVPADKFTGYDKNTLGEQTITVTYSEGITADFKVNVHNEVTGIEITKAPTKTTYVKGEELDLTGIEVTATYEDGTTGVITVTADKVTGYDKNTLGEQTVTVTYAEGKTAEFKVNVHNNVTAIEVTKAPTKTTYVKGEELDLTGIEVTATYEDGTTGVIAVPADKFTGYDKNTLGEQTVTVTYAEGKTAEFKVNVHNEVTGIEITKAPTKTTYVKGEELDLAGIEVTATYEDGTTGVIAVPADKFTGYDKNTLGEQTVTVTYAEGKTAEFKVNVHNEVTGIEITKAPTKTTYVKGEELDLSGLEVTATYEDGTTGVIELPADKFTGYDKNTLGEQTVTVTYAEGKTAEFKVNVYNEVTAIEVTKAPNKTSYVKGEELNLAGIEVTATFEDGTTGVIAVPADKFTGYDKNTLGEQTVTVTYAEGITADFKVNVHNNITAIEVTKAPTKTTYVKGEELDLAGIEVTATYEDGTTGVIELPADKFTGYDKNTLGEQTVTVTYAEGITAEFKVNVHKEVTGIEITKAPTKTTYVKGEELDLSGMEVTATYEDGTTGVIELPADKFTGYDKNTLGEQTVTVTYTEGKTAEFKVNVHNEVTGIEITKAPTKTLYVKGEELNLDGIEVTATYEDGTTGVIELPADKFTGYDKNTLGEQTVTVTYAEGKTAEFKVNVHNSEINNTKKDISKEDSNMNTKKGKNVDENIAKGILPNTGAGHVSVLAIGIFIIIIIGCFILYINKSTKNIEK